MKSLNPTLFFRMTLLVIFNLFVNNVVLLILSIFLLFVIDRKLNIVFAILFSIILFTNTVNYDFVPIGIVESEESNYYIVNKVFYKEKVYSNSLEIGDITVNKGTDSEKSTNKHDLKNNILFNCDSEFNTIYNIHIKKYINNRINNLNDNIKPYIKEIVLNEYNYDDLNGIGFGLAIYYLLILIKKHSKSLCVTLMLLYSIIFKFDIKFYLIIIDLLFSNFHISKLKILSIKILFCLMINKYLLYNYSILISLIIGLYNLSKYRNDRSIFVILESLLFSEIALIPLFLFKYLMHIRIILLVLSILYILFNYNENIILWIFNSFSNIYSITNISVRGKLTIASIILIVVIYKCFRINKQYIKIAVICLILLTPINNPFKHVTFIDVGQGDSILIHDYFNKHNVLIDTGSAYNYSKLKKRLLKEGIYKIDYLVITHDDTDHSGNIMSLIRDFKVDEVVKEGKDIHLNRDVLRYINIGKYDNDNDNSLIYLLNVDRFSMLFTGDVSSNVENKIFNCVHNRIDVLKVSHHGSKSATTKYFVGKLLPKFSIISTSGQYNHPSKDVVDNLIAYRSDIYITKEKGDISFYFLKVINFIKTGNFEFVII